MGKKIIQFAASLFAAVICLSGVVSAADAAEQDVIRVGLFYGSSALPGANLLNDVGTGYRFGYFDGDARFCPVGSTGESAISVVKTQNVYYGKVGDWAGYYDTITSDIAVGCWHVQLPTAYGTFEAAQEAAVSVPGGFPAWIEGTYYVRAGAYLTSGEANAAAAALGAAGAEAVGTSSSGVSVVRTGTSRVLFQFDGGAGVSLAVRPGLEDGVKTVTHFRGYRYYGDFQYQRRSGGNLTVVNFVPMEDYVNCVISREMSNSWPLEALKAQAVCARTYAAMNRNKHSSNGFDVCGSTDCQVYFGTAWTGTNTARAAEETAGKHVWYGGSMAQTFYFSCDGGATESVGNVWRSDVDMPYLKGVVDPYEADVASQIEKYTSTVTFTKRELKELLHSKNYMCADVVDFRVTETTPTGNVLTVTVFDAAGKSWSFSKEKARTFFGLRSQRYTISGSGTSYYVNKDGVLSSMSGVYAVNGSGSVSQVPSGSMPYVVTRDGIARMEGEAASGNTFTVTTYGWGHNVGMSQWGANAMARRGHTYEEILKFYFTGVEVR